MHLPAVPVPVRAPALPATVLTAVHKYKACLTFFWRKYPHPSQIRSYFPEVNFNAQNTTELLNYYTSLRKYYFDTMEGMARAALASGIDHFSDLDLRPENEDIVALLAFFDPLKISCQPDEFIKEIGTVVREFFQAIQLGEDTTDGWKRRIHKIVSSGDMDVPEWLRDGNVIELAEIHKPIR